VVPTAHVPVQGFLPSSGCSASTSTSTSPSIGLHGNAAGAPLHATGVYCNFIKRKINAKIAKLNATSLGCRRGSPFCSGAIRAKNYGTRPVAHFKWVAIYESGKQSWARQTRENGWLGIWVVQPPGWCNNRHGRVKVACRILNSLSIVAVSDSAGRLHNLSSRAAHQIKVQFKFN